MTKVFLLLIMAISILTALTGTTWPPNPHTVSQQTSQMAAPSSEPGIKVTIATVGSSLGPPTNRYKVGDQIPVTITMTNTSSTALSVCISSDLYQNLPKLTKDGVVVPYMKWQSYERVNAQKNHTCNDENLPEPVLLRPNEPTQADFLVLVDGRISSGAEGWYDPLSPGKYELSIQRRLNCCDGPMVESNQISFEVEQ
jgi:hypothetical protein